MKRATSNYLKRISEVAKEGFSSVEEKDNCLENVFSELEEEGMVICQSPETSMIIEQFVSIANAEHLKTLFKVLKKDVTEVLKDRYASHVLESILLRSTKLIQDHVLDFQPLETTEPDDYEKTEDSLISLILSLSELVSQEVSEYLTDSYSSHVIRALLQTVGGTSVEFKIDRQKKGPKKDAQMPKFKDFEVPVLFRSVLKQFGKKLFGIDKLNVLLMDTHASTVIQIFLLVCHKVDDALCQKYIKKLIKLAQISEEAVGGGNVNLPPVATDKVGSFLVQQIMSLASGDVYKRLYVRLFKGKMLPFAIHPKGNFILQSLLESCADKEIFKEQFDELQNHFEDVLAYGHYGVIVSMAKTCQRLECGQKPFKQQLMSALHCRDPQTRQKKIALLALTMRTYEVYYNLPEEENKDTEKKTETEVPEVTLKGPSINYFGSTLLQEMLQFNGTQLIVDGLLDFTAEDLSTISCSSVGSYVLEKFFFSKTVSKDAKDSLINNWKGKSIDIACNRIGCQTIQSLWSLFNLANIKPYVGKSIDIACNRIGCQTIQSLWSLFNLAQKASLSEELCKDEIKVRSDQFGKYVYANLALQHFKKRPKDWEWIQQKEVKKRKLFNEFIGSGTAHKRKKGAGMGTDEEELKIDGIEDDEMEDVSNRGHFSDEPFEENQKSYVFDRSKTRGGGSFRGRGRGDNQFRGGSRGRGDRPFRGRGGYSDRNSSDDNFGRREGGWRGRENFRGRGSFRGRGDKRGRGGFEGHSNGDDEIGKSGSFGGRGGKRGGKG